jgi:hypothetical protein
MFTDREVLPEVEGKLTGKNYLAKIFNSADAVHSTFRKLKEIKWPKKIGDQIREKLEMPREWFEKRQAQGYPSLNLGDPVTMDAQFRMLDAQVEIVLAKTLLVYERLNKFYQ